MASVNVTIRVEEETKRQFDDFCENVGMNITTALNMFIKAVLRNRELPFPVTDYDSEKQTRKALWEAFRTMQEQSVLNGTDKMTLDEINAIITECRQEKVLKND